MPLDSSCPLADSAPLLTSLPPELILHLADDLPLGPLNDLVQSCTQLHAILQPVLDARLTPERAQAILLPAARAGKTAVVAKLLRQADPNAYKLRWEETPLHAAAAAGHLDIARQLLDAGADCSRTCDMQYEDDMQPLHLAVRRDDLAMVTLLLERGAPVNDIYGCESMSCALPDAVSRGNIEIVRALLAHGADTERPGYYGSALGHAIRRRDVALIRLLLEEGHADADATTPLNPGWLCGGPPAPHGATLLYLVLALKHPKGEHTPRPIPVEGREEIMGLLMKHGATKAKAMETVNKYLEKLAEAEGVSEKALLEKIEGIFASVRV
ncbi:Ankyrin repeat domain-containing protein 50 [Mycena kentingensis (nom. inval.)]|nr:Ankyrin repeat domain-containing protein 50 [Mycena kentingensis (nom. inval.)]